MRSHAGLIINQALRIPAGLYCASCSGGIARRYYFYLGPHNPPAADLQETKIELQRGRGAGHWSGQRPAHGQTCSAWLDACGAFAHAVRLRTLVFGVASPSGNWGRARGRGRSYIEPISL